MMNIPANLYPGARLSLKHFGVGYVTKVPRHKTGEFVVDVKTGTGENLCLSLAYASRCVDAQPAFAR